MTGRNAKYGPLARGIRRDLAEKGWVPLRFWVIWWAVAVNASCWVPMPWQFSHWTLASCGVAVASWNPPGWL